MTTSDGFDPDDVIVNGIVRFVEATGDKSYGEMGGAMYRSVADVFRQQLKPGDTCLMAMPSMIIRPDIRTECFVAITSSSVVVAWKKGMFRKTTESEVIPLSSITDATWEISTQASTRGAALMHVKADRNLTFALPKGRPGVADAIREALLKQS